MFWSCQSRRNYVMVRIPNNIDTVKIYKRPVSIIEDIFDLEIVIGLVDVN